MSCASARVMARMRHTVGSFRSLTIIARLIGGDRLGIVSRIARLVGRRDGVIVPEYPVRPRARWGWDGQPVHPELAALFDRADERSRAVLGRATDLLDWARSIPRSAGDGGVCWDNDWWGGLDALVHVALLRDRNPQTYLEVGSGYSTRFARRAI